MIRRYLSLPSNFSIDISPSSFFFHPTSRLNIERYPLFEGIFHAFHQKNQRSRDEMKALRPGTSQTLIEPRLLLADVFQNPSSFSSSSSFSNEVSINFSSVFEGEFFRGRGGKERDGGNECEIIARNNGTKRARRLAQRWAKPRGRCILPAAVRAVVSCALTAARADCLLKNRRSWGYSIVVSWGEINFRSISISPRFIDRESGQSLGI